MTVRAQFKSVKQAIDAAARRAGRQPSSVKLVAVSKTYDGDHIRPVLHAGHRVFGENRVQEAKQKWPTLRDAYPGLELHLIGPLQSNKAAEAVALFDVIQTVDRPRIAEALASEMKKQQRFPKLFVQVNTGLEPQKAGIAPKDLPAFLELLRGGLGLTVEGLMCIPPVDDEPQRHFRILADLAKTHGLQGLSMGMSGDYENAIAEGATLVRVGSAIFGARDYKTP
jgi:PLP dependent protein